MYSQCLAISHILTLFLTQIFDYVSMHYNDDYYTWKASILLRIDLQIQIQEYSTHIYICRHYCKYLLGLTQ